MSSGNDEASSCLMAVEAKVEGYAADLKDSGFGGYVVLLLRFDDRRKVPRSVARSLAAIRVVGDDVEGKKGGRCLYGTVEQ